MFGSVCAARPCSSALEGGPEEVDFVQRPKKMGLDPAFLTQAENTQRKSTGGFQILIPACLYLGLLLSYL